ncbi:MAG: ferrochelatase [Verrucomicrobiales bacterium]|nr:ferrochelatase [Verrucomicrobiales bacterium]
MHPRRAILLVNLGSPDAPTVSAVRRYLREFLMDGRVLDTNFLLRWLIVHCLVLPRRPRRSARAYQQIWTAAGSPLTVSGQRLRDLLQQQTALPVALGMRYGNPSIRAALEQLRAHRQRPGEILLLPLYPHYTPATWETAVAKTRAELARLRWRVPLTVLPPFYREPAYLAALTASIREPLAVSGADYVLFSYHGIPLQQLRHKFPGDRADYRAQCQATTAAVAARLALSAGAYSTAFQSRFGRAPWCQPYTDREIIRLANSGVKHLAVVCPAFVADCLETLEEIGLAGRDRFRANGGETFRLIPCLNNHPLWVTALRDWAEHYPAAR